MKVLVDTSVWSLALRRKNVVASAAAEELQALIRDNRVQIIGPVRQELLSGIRHSRQFNSLRKHLESFPDLAILTADYVTAARFSNLCRANGVQGSNTDFLICGVAARKRLPIFTLDNDFALFAKHLPILLYQPKRFPASAGTGSIRHRV